jgi:diguanylate cyclase (GGDEF)-like protein
VFLAVFKRNIWSLFWLVVTSGLAVLVLAFYLTWQNTLRDFEAQHSARVELIAQTLSDVLKTQEVILDVAAIEMLRAGHVDGERETLPILDTIHRASPVLVGVGLALPNGQLVKVSSSVDHTNLPNLLSQAETRQGFLAALESDGPVVGRTYFMEAAQAWIIPLRKAVRDDQGNVVAVMSAGLRVGGEHGVLGNDLHKGAHDSVIVYRERDGYLQLMSSEGMTPESFTRIHRTPAQQEEDRRAFLDSNRASWEQIMTSREPAIYHSERDSVRYMGSAVYLPDYQLWVISETSFIPVRATFSSRATGFIAIFLVLTGLIFSLSRMIDRAERKRRDELFYQSRHDELTSLTNRIGLIDRVQSLVDHGEHFSIVLLDIDNFRGINDRFGQEHGDRVLGELGFCLRNLAREGDVATRLGGDEFALVTDVCDAESLEGYCRELLRGLTRMMASGPLRLQFGASLGGAVFPDHGNSFNGILRAAHLALYQAKRRRNSVCLYQKDIEADYLRRVHIEQRLRLALESNDIFMVYQPQLNSDRSVVGIEALARWKDEELGFVPPNEFVDVAEASGMMEKLGNYVLEKSFADFSKISEQVAQPLELSVNISVLQFMQTDFAELVMSALARYRINPRRVTLEITETLFMSGFDTVLPLLHRLRGEGISLSMDDFGTGYSSLSLLRRLPIDELKIDKSFVDFINTEEPARNMVESIIAIGHNHNMRLVAEGVEDEDQFETLRQMGCSRYQGYYFSRPVDPPDLVRFLDASD